MPLDVDLFEDADETPLGHGRVYLRGSAVFVCFDRCTASSVDRQLLDVDADTAALQRGADVIGCCVTELPAGAWEYRYELRHFRDTP